MISPFEEIEFHDKKFLISPCCSSRPAWLKNSFFIEKDIIDKWWDIKKGDIVLDIGAAYGSYTLPALASGAALVVAFEPGKDELFDLCTHLLANNFSGRCLLVNVMASDVNGISIYYPDSHSTRPEGVMEHRFALTVDTIIEQHEIDRVDWVKIDVDDMEEKVVIGAMETLKKHSPKLIIENHVQYIPDIEERLRKLLLPLGYEEEQHLRWKDDELQGNWSKWTWNG